MACTGCKAPTYEYGSGHECGCTGESVCYSCDTICTVCWADRQLASLEPANPPTWWARITLEDV